MSKKVCDAFSYAKVWKSAVLKQMEQSPWDWWGSTDLARDRIIKVLEWLNPEEARKAKNKFLYNLYNINIHEKLAMQKKREDVYSSRNSD